MHSSIILAAVCALSGAASAACLTDSNAQQVANNFATLFSNYTAAFANQTLASNYTDQTDSVDWLMSNGTMCPKALGSETFSSRAAFEAAQATQPNMPFNVENTFHDCTNVFIRWKFTVKPQQVQGIAILQTIPNPKSPDNQQQPFLIDNVFSEFNTGAFITNLGYYHGTSPCGAGASKRDADGSDMPAMWMS
ncbi:Hypothetical predicted protein [Lecanosticta acicola]|uniref:NTF2-like domain-containing protein n=1 Tax=Lecanosticta acicola TaxID=111012 RepID=A0AAI8YS95_9PEZI|nr:Hypothetical predicted protein [Lecanosticta acicola]